MENKMIYTLLVFSLLFLSANLVSAAPAPWGIALNHETKECAGYWAGDEFTYYELPSGWKAYYPWINYENESLEALQGFIAIREDIEAEIGSFNITKEEFLSMWPSRSTPNEEFCNTTGYTYISSNVGIKSNLTDLGMQKPLIENIWIIIFILAATIVIIFILYKIKEKKSEN